jgi:hypothetical protein
VEFGTSTIYSVRVQEMQHLGYFWDGVGKALGAEEVLEPEGSWFFCGVFHCWTSLACASVCGQSVVALQSSDSPSYVEHHDGTGKVCVGCDFVWWRSLG